MVVVNTCSVTGDRRSGRAPDDPADRPRQSRRAHRRHRVLRDARRRRISQPCPASSGSSPTTTRTISSARLRSVRTDDRRAVRRRRRPVRRADRARPRRPDRLHAARADRLRGALRATASSRRRGARAAACRSTQVLPRSSAIAAAGFREVALTGVHLGSYGRDLTPRASLLGLLRALDACAADVIASASARSSRWTARRTIVALVADSGGRFAPHFHLPLQHASDPDAGGDAAAVHARRTIAAWWTASSRGLPHASIGSDMIVGFPGRDRRGLCRRTCEYLPRVAALAPARLSVFGSSRHEAASAMTGEVPAPVVRERGARLREIGARARAAVSGEAQVGTIRPGLTLEDGTLVVTDNYLKVRIPPGLSATDTRGDGAASRDGCYRDVLTRAEPAGAWSHRRTQLLSLLSGLQSRVRLRPWLLGAGQFCPAPGRRLGDQLTAGGADVAAARLAHRHGDAVRRRESARTGSRARPTAARTGMPAASFSGSRFTFALMPSEELHQAPRVLRRVVDARSAARTRR